MATVLKHIIKATAFTLILVLLLVITSQMFQPKNNDEASGILDYRANGILSEAENSIDIVVLGDSESYCGFIPLALWKNTGIASYVCGTSGQTLCYTNEFLHKVFETQSPKLIVLEAHTILTSYGMAGRLTFKAQQLFPVLRYHNLWKTTSPKEWLSPLHYTAECEDKGYYYSELVAGTAAGDYMADKGVVNAVSGRNSDYIAKMRDFCTRHGATLMFVSVPSALNWNYANHIAISALAEELNVEYVDLNLFNNEIGIDWAADTMDGGDHLNVYGAKKVTAYFGEYLKSTYSFDDRRTDNAYARWNTLAHKY